VAMAFMDRAPVGYITPSDGRAAKTSEHAPTHTDA